MRMLRFVMPVMAIVGLVAVAGGAVAAEHIVEMRNKGAKGAMVFEPDFVKIAPGDSVKFVLVDKPHNAESIDGMIPEGATGFKGEMNEEIVVTPDQPGLYAYKCTPHFGMGMVGVIQVGDDPVNLEAVKAAAAKLRGRTKKNFEAIFASLGN